MDHVFICLHCQQPFVIHGNDFNCRILRHGVFKENLQPIPPHATKDECNALVQSGTIYGCAGPLQIVAGGGAGGGDGAWDVVICDYI